MPLNPTTLANGLAAMTPTTDEAVARSRFAGAWRTYFAGATVAGASAVPSAFEPAVSALEAGLVGMSASGAATAILTSALGTFWTTLAPLATAVWVTAPIVLIPPVVPPPGLAGLAAALSAVFASNLSGRLSLSDAAQQLATVLHTNAGLGALVPGSVPPAPPAPVPVL